MTNEGAPPLKIAEGLDVRAIARVYAGAGRVHVRPIFPEPVATRIYECMAKEVQWHLQLNDGDRALSRDGPSFDALAEADRTRVMQTVYGNAAHRFQYIYNNLPLSDLQGRDEFRDLYLMRVLEFLNSAPFLEFARQITGTSSISLVDAQATLYRPGHFLTRHDDLVADKKRVAAYVLNFTPRWKADWGGILQFIDRDGHVAEGYTPMFNALNVFRVPQPHSVSIVAPFAQGGRYSITGWFRET
jgi:SM-20-related protein